MEAPQSFRIDRNLFQRCGSMVDCTRFLECYSAFRDGELENDVRVDFEMHLELCPSCARYDRVISEGVRVYRRCGEVVPSEDFLPRLQHRLYRIDEEAKGPGRSGSGTRAAVTLAIAASIASLAWIPALRPTAEVVQLPAVAARAPVPAPPQPALLDQNDFFFAPVYAPFGGWSSWSEAQLANDLLFRYSSAGSNYTVQQVLGR